MNADELKRLKELAEKATPGPWQTDQDRGDVIETSVYVWPPAGFSICNIPIGAGNWRRRHAEQQERKNAAFIAAARIAVPTLIAEVERQAAEVAKLTQERNEERELAEDWQRLHQIVTRRAEAAESALARLTTPGKEKNKPHRDMGPGFTHTETNCPCQGAVLDADGEG